MWTAKAWTFVLTAFTVGVVGIPSHAQVNREPAPLRNFRSFERSTYPNAPSGTIMEIAEDDRGILWVLADGDIRRFDGRRFEVTESGPAVPLPGQVSGFAPRRRGGMYVAQWKGVSLWDGSRWSLMPRKGSVVAIAEDRFDRLWTLSEDGALRYRQPGTIGWRVSAGLPYAGDLIGGAQGVWAWLNGFAYRLDAGPQGVAVGGGPLPGLRHTVSAGDHNGTLWAGTMDGSIFNAPAGGLWRRVDMGDCKLSFARGIAEDKSGRIWIGDNTGALCHGSEREGWKMWTSEHGLKPAGILKVFFDRRGSLWIGYNTDGLQQLVAPEWSHRTQWRDVHGSLAAVSDIAGTSNGGFLAAVFKKGVWHWDGSTMRTYGAEDGLNQDGMAVTEPKAGTIWVGARYGIFESRDGGRFRKTMEIPAGIVAAFFRSPDGTHYAGTTLRGLFVLRNGQWHSETSINRKLLDDDVRQLVWRRNGELWVATRTGVAIFRGSTVRYLRAATAGMPATVSDLLEVSQDEMWISGTGGVLVVRADGNRSLTERDGLPGVRVSAMGLDGAGNVWVLGAGGVVRISPGYRVTKWDATVMLEPQGLLGSLWVDPRGNVYVGTIHTLSRYDSSVAVKPPARLRLFWKGGPGTAAGPAESLEDRTARWTWHAPNLQPGALEYRFRMPGLHKAWSPPQSEAALTIPTLPHGQWQIQVEGRRLGTKAWSAPLTATFTVRPRAWETIWAKLLYVVLLFALVFMIVMMRSRHDRARAAELDRQVLERTNELTTAYEKVEEANGKLAHLARTDALTGLANRGALDVLLQNEFQRAARTGQSLAVVLGDVDHFKRYNDHYGHPEGDRCLQGVAAALQRAACRPGDAAARYGGEEFLLILPDTDLNGAIEVAERVMREVASANIAHAASAVSRRVTMSLGVAAVVSGELASPAELIGIADKALYAAKDGGRNRWHAMTATLEVADADADLPIAV